MKTLLIAIGIFITSFVKANVNIYNNTGKKDEIIKTTIQIAAQELGVDTISVYVSFSMFDEKLKNIGGEGSVKKFSYNQYLINISTDLPKYELILAIIHEMVHVKQMIDRRLVIQRFSNWFEGKIYTNSTIYEERPYEKEAEKQSIDIYVKHKHLFKTL